MFDFLKRKKNIANQILEGDGSENDTEESEEGGNSNEKTKEHQPVKVSENASQDVVKLSTEVDKINASIESFGEVRKGLNERINHLGQQIGEIRGMIMDRDRTIQEIEFKAVKAADLVESVHPDKLMIEIQKEDAKFEALKANLEGNESIMHRMMDEVKEMRRKLEFFTGIEEIIKLGEEVKKELVEIKKVEAKISIQTDKIETIYSELRTRVQEIDVFNDSLQEMKVNFQQNSKDIDAIKLKISNLAEKQELDSLIKKVQRYIDVLKEIDKETSLSKDLSQLKSLLESVK